MPSPSWRPGLVHSPQQRPPASPARRGHGTRRPGRALWLSPPANSSRTNTTGYQLGGGADRPKVDHALTKLTLGGTSKGTWNRAGP